MAESTLPRLGPSISSTLRCTLHDCDDTADNPHVIQVVAELLAGNIDADKAIVELYALHAPSWLIRSCKSVEDQARQWKELGVLYEPHS